MARVDTKKALRSVAGVAKRIAFEPLVNVPATNVQDAITQIENNIGGLPSGSLPLMDGTAAVGVSVQYSRGDHIHPTDTTRAPIISPNFQTQINITNASGRSLVEFDGSKVWQIFVETAGGGGYLAFYDSTDNKTTLALAPGQFTMYSTVELGWNSDASFAYSNSQDTALGRNAAGVVEINNGTLGTYRDLILRNLTVNGTPTAPTAAIGTNTTQLATTAFVKSGVALAASTDFNTITSPGTYSTVDALSTNAPTADYYYLFVQYFSTAGYTSQTAVGVNTGVRWQRINLGGTWQAWHQIAYTDSPTFTGTPTVPTAGLGTNTTQAASTAFVLANGGGVPSGTHMLFQQTAAPTGWTKITTFNDAAIRVVSGTAGSGGTNTFSAVMSQTTVGSHTLVAAEVPNLSVSVNGTMPWTSLGMNISSDGTVVAYSGGTTNLNSTGATTTGGGGAHNHTIGLAMTYVDVIIASKN